MTESGFEAVGPGYDGVFTQSAVGRAQRDVVWRYLGDEVLGAGPLDVLDLGCGTGEDAVHLARHGHHVLAVDSARKMVEAAAAKAEAADVGPAVELRCLDLRAAPAGLAGRSFDLVMSNFGALNCLSPDDLEILFGELVQVLRPGASLIVVVMPRVCAWESLWFGVRGRWSEARRRWHGGPVEAPVGPTKVTTWYHGPSDLAALLEPRFQIRAVRSVGFAVPPSYLDPLVAERPRLLRALAWLDRHTWRWAWTARMADHMLVHATCDGQLT